MIAQYVANRRSLDFPNFAREDLGYLVRYTPADPASGAGGMVCWTALDSDRLAEAIRVECAHFQTHRCEFEWKVHDFDRPADLREQLLEHGFEQGPEEALMILDLRQREPQVPRIIDGVDVRRIDDPKDIPEIVKVQEAIWDRPLPWLAEQLLSSFDTRTIFGAFVDGSLVGKGWTDYYEDSLIADLHGGAVLPEHRGRGIYSRLFEERVIDATEKGIQFLAVDAAPMSRPILERKGFHFLCMTYPLTSQRHT